VILLFLTALRDDGKRAARYPRTGASVKLDPSTVFGRRLATLIEEVDVAGELGLRILARLPRQHREQIVQLTQRETAPWLRFFCAMATS
jgi:hypothetical protein